MSLDDNWFYTSQLFPTTQVFAYYHMPLITFIETVSVHNVTSNISGLSARIQDMCRNTGYFDHKGLPMYRPSTTKTRCKVFFVYIEILGN